MRLHAIRNAVVLVVALALGLVAAPGRAAGAEDPPRANEASYRVRPGDLLALWVYKAPDFNLELRVAPNGDLSVPLVGRVKGAGRSLEEITAEVREGLMKQAKLLDPQVSLSIREYASLRAYIHGAVRDPKAIDWTTQQQMTVSRAIAMAGGLSDDADPSGVRIDRRPGEGKGEELVVNLQAAMEGRGSEQDMPLHAGDAVYVPRGLGVYVLGGVKEPGFYTRRTLAGAATNIPFTASQAITLARGMAQGAQGKLAKVIRPAADGKGAPEVIAVDLAEVMGQGLTEKDVVLKQGDSLFIPQGEGVYVLGAVNKGGVYYSDSGAPLTVMKAVALAGSFADFAKKSSVRVISRSGVRVVDLDEMTDTKKSDASQDPPLSPGDVVFVPKGF
ncbi:MAG: SLBB domain-containing protein [Planctomycetes bacterium]|nr:SLBB domain-containing protein [Planctomycetota bacterium]